jgi:hypothetical protein
MFRVCFNANEFLRADASLLDRTQFLRFSVSQAQYAEFRLGNFGKMIPIHAPGAQVLSFL